MVTDCPILVKKREMHDSPSLLRGGARSDVLALEAEDVARQRDPDTARFDIP